MFTSIDGETSLRSFNQENITKNGVKMGAIMSDERYQNMYLMVIAIITIIIIFNINIIIDASARMLSSFEVFSPKKNMKI